MTEDPYAITVDDLVAGVRVAVADQVAEQSELRPVQDSWPGPGPYADVMSGDADGE
jgi:hypothetical protein